jgi:hypothetical protein
MSAFLFCFFVLTLALIATVGVAACSGGASARPIRLGQRLLCVMGAFSLVLVLARRNDWVHLQWSVTYPMWGMFTGVGLLLLQTWPRDRALRPAAWYGRNGATIALVWLLALGVLPPVLAHALCEPFPVGRVSGSSFAALFDVARYGFGGSIPSLMVPVTEDQLARGLGSPPRFVTVALLTSMTAAAAVIVFVALALIGRLIPLTALRGMFWLLSPVAIVLASSLEVAPLSRALWTNEPWAVQLYGPTIVIAIVAAALLSVAVALDGWRFRRAGGGAPDRHDSQLARSDGTIRSSHGPTALRPHSIRGAGRRPELRPQVAARRA